MYLSACTIYTTVTSVITQYRTKYKLENSNGKSLLQLLCGRRTYMKEIEGMPDIWRNASQLITVSGSVFKWDVAINIVEPLPFKNAVAPFLGLCTLFSFVYHRCSDSVNI